MEVINLNGQKYYNADKVKEQHPFLFRRCKRVRKIITERRLRSEDYCFAVKNKVDKTWTLGRRGNSHAKLLIKKQYIDHAIIYRDQPMARTKNASNKKNNSDSDDESDTDTKTKKKKLVSDSDNESDIDTKTKKKKQVNDSDDDPDTDTTTKKKKQVSDSDDDSDTDTDTKKKTKKPINDSDDGSDSDTKT
jgi:hypothetical protein